MRILRARWLEFDSGNRARNDFWVRAHSGILLALVSFTSCNSFGPPPASLLEQLPIETATSTHRQAQHSRHVSIESEELSGEFEAVAATRSAPDAGARLQLFGDLGGKMLDLSAQADRFVGYFPHAMIGIDHSASAGELPRHLITFMAASLLESSNSITKERVRGARVLGGNRGWQLDLTPILKGVELTAIVSPSGQLLERHYRVRGVGWSEVLGPPHVFMGHAFTLTMTEERSTPTSELSDRTFELDLPEGFGP